MKITFVSALAGLAATMNFADATPAAESMEQQRVAWQLYRAQAKGSENLFFSPASVQAALALALEGSAGELRERGRKFWGFSGTGPAPLRPHLLTVLGELRSGPGVELLSANAIWLNTALKGVGAPTAAYRLVAEEQYGALVRGMPFSPAAPAATAINQWVREHTKGMVTKLVEPGDLRDLSLLLANAVYFKGSWQKKFDPALTKPAVFHGLRQKKKVPFLNQTGSFSYFENDEAQVITLPYGESGRVVMTLALPLAGKTLAQVEAKLDPDKFGAWLGRHSARQVALQMPKFELNWGPRDLLSPLVEAGLPVRGDYSPMGAANMEIAKVIHRAVIKVDEQGTEAAAATGVGMVLTSAPAEPTAFVANRPFLFVIHDTVSGTWLFAGRYVQP